MKLSELARFSGQISVSMVKCAGLPGTYLKRLIWILWACLLIAILWGSLLPNFGPSNKYDFDKFVHLGAYLTLALLPTLVLEKWRYVAILFMALVVISGMVELLQSSIPGREGSITDLAANATGAAIGIMIARITRLRYSLA